jgi:hypothetical protein
MIKSEKTQTKKKNCFDLLFEFSFLIGSSVCFFFRSSWVTKFTPKILPNEEKHNQHPLKKNKSPNHFKKLFSVFHFGKKENRQFSRNLDRVLLFYVTQESQRGKKLRRILFFNAA